MAVTFGDLCEKLKHSGKVYPIPPIEKAYLLAEKSHDGQMRESGEPYIIHPLSVALLLVDLGMDAECIIAGLLHDAVS